MTLSQRFRGLASRFRRLWRDSRANAAVEFALVLPVMLTLIIGTVQYGNIMLTKNMMVQAARQAARAYSVGSAASTSAAEEIATNFLASTSLTYTVSATTAAGASGTEVTVTISVPMADAGLIGGLEGVLSGTLTATVTMRVES